MTDDPCDEWPFCQHDMERGGTMGGSVVWYECRWCGEVEEVDRS